MISALVAGTGDPLNGLITPGNQKGFHYPSSLSELRNNIGPRVGFAYTPGTGGTTAIRGGFGIFYHWDNDNHENGATNPPFSTTGPAYGVSLSNFGSTATTIFPPTLNVWDPHKLYAMISQYSFTVEQQLPFATNFNGVGTTYGSAAFGTLTSALDPRNVQFRLNFSF